MTDVRTSPAPGSPTYRPPRTRDGAPNVVMFVLDDTGFAQLGSFGSSLDTPVMDRLAAGGLRYNAFHVTALCSPTRASLLTGRNHHAVGMGFLADIPTTHPGYGARFPDTAAPLPRVMREAGYSTIAIGKWHLTPRGERNAAGPFDRWPLGLGFERYYGFLGGDTNAWAPYLACDNHFVDAPRTPEDGYHVAEDLADHAIRYVQDQKQAAPDQPFFLYWATLATHAPHHVTPEWIEPYRGRFDDGWDRERDRIFERQVADGVVPEQTMLPPRPSWVEGWDDLDADARRVFSRMYEVYGGFTTHNDAQLGRFLDFLESIGELDNTIVLVISDNGASAEGGPLGTWNEHRFPIAKPESIEDLLGRLDDLGGPKTYPHYAWGWAWAGNTPYKLWKRYTWLGGTRTPLIAHWPEGIERSGEVRSQFCHAVDITPTILDVCGIDVPEVHRGVEQQPMHGSSLAATFTDPEAPGRDTQYFEMLGSRSIYHQGWKATTDHIGEGVAAERELLEGSIDFDTDRWSLYDLRSDPAEANDVAADHPDLLADLTARWDGEAERYAVLPMMDSLTSRISEMAEPTRPMRTESVYRPGGGPIADEALPLLLLGFEIAAHVEVGPDGAEGVLVALGDSMGGFALYGHRGRLVFSVSLAGDMVRVESEVDVHRGASVLAVRFRSDDGGVIELLADGDVVGTGPVGEPFPMAWQHGGAGLRIGQDAGLAVGDDYRPPFAWTGTIDRVVVTGGLPDRTVIEGEVEAALHAD